MKPLTVLQGGRNRPALIQVERREWEELSVELAVSRAERLAFAHAVRNHALWAAHSFATGRDDPERHITALLRLAAQEEARALASGDLDDGPAALRVAA